jgi:hypothetical protein
MDKGVEPEQLPEAAPVTLRGFASSVAMLAASYALVDFILLPENRLTLFPFNSDDYRNLSAALSWLPRYPVRPVSTAAIALAAQVGRGFFYVVLQGLTLLSAVLVLLFVGRLLRRQISAGMTFLFGMALFSFADSLQWMKYTGLITNLLSGVFGTLAMLLLLRSAEEGGGEKKLAGALFLFALGVFSKEDFALPFLLLAIFLAWEARPVRRRMLAAFVASVVLTAASLSYNNFLAHSSFTQLTSEGPHAISFSPASVLHLFFRYASATPYLAAVSALFCGAAAFAAATLPKIRRRIFLCVVLAASVIAPYAILPNHFFRYYAFPLVVWELAAVAALGESLAAGLSPARRRFAAALSFLGAGCCVAATVASRRAIVEKYEVAAARNRRMVEVVMTHRKRIAASPVVGVMGLSGRTPWTNNRGEYFSRKLGLSNRWLVFVPQSSLFFQIGWGDGVETGSLIHVRPLSEAKDAVHIPFLEFDEAGNGHLVEGAPPNAGAAIR